MSILIFVLGFVLGVIIMLIHRSNERIHGVVDIDHNTKQCKFHITSAELSDSSKKIAVFVINHNAEISREEQGL